MKVQIDGKDVIIPEPPIYVLKSAGFVVDIDTSHYDIHKEFDGLNMRDRELWKLDEKHTWHLIRLMRNGREAGCLTNPN